MSRQLLTRIKFNFQKGCKGTTFIRSTNDSGLATRLQPPLLFKYSNRCLHKNAKDHPHGGFTKEKESKPENTINELKWDQISLEQSLLYDNEKLLVYQLKKHKEKAERLHNGDCIFNGFLNILFLKALKKDQKLLVRYLLDTYGHETSEKTYELFLRLCE